MKNQKVKLLILLMAFYSGLLYADGPGWTDFSEVVEVVTVVNGGINVKLSPALSGCQSMSGYGPDFASVYPDHPGLNLFQANLLAAMMSGKQVRLYLGDATCKVTEMRIKK